MFPTVDEMVYAPGITVVPSTTGNTAYLSKCVRSVQKQQTTFPVHHLVFVDGPEAAPGVQEVLSHVRGQVHAPSLQVTSLKKVCEEEQKPGGLASVQQPDSTPTHSSGSIKCEHFTSVVTVDVVCLPHNLGAGGWNGHRAYGASLHLVRTKWLCFLDEDNFLDPNHLQTCYELLQSSGGASERFQMVYALRKIVNREGSFVCQDNCESLGALHPIWHLAVEGTDNNSLSYEHHLIDLNCFVVERFSMLQGNFSSLFAVRAGCRPPNREIDRALTQAMHSTLKCACTMQYSVNYMAGESIGPVVGCVLPCARWTSLLISVNLRLFSDPAPPQYV